MQLSNYNQYGTNINHGLQVTTNGFELNQREIILYSGSIHYYRIPKMYWRPRLQQMRMGGLNTIETNIPWNLHEPIPGVYEFGNSSTEFQHLLDVENFLKIAQEEDLFCVVRIGAVVDYGLDNGGMPSWLNKFRSNKSYLKFLHGFIANLLLILANLQFKNGGPIIGFYIEDPDSMYFEYFSKKFGLDEFVFNLIELSLKNRCICPGIVKIGDIPKLKIGNHSTKENITHQQHELWKNPNLMIIEEETILDIAIIFKDIVYVNFYGFTGGTTFGFLNGAHFPNSYDFESPISETGRRRSKYFLIQQLILNVGYHDNYKHVPDEIVYSSDITGHTTLKKILDNQVTFLNSENLIPMEELPIYNNSGQSYGYIIYRKTQIHIPFNSQISIKGTIYDNVIILVNAAVQTISRDYIINLGARELKNATLDIIIENSGRSPDEKQYKGLWKNQVTLNNTTLLNWKIFPLEFKSDWTDNLKQWHPAVLQPTPSLYMCIIDLYALDDLFLDMKNWQKGIAIINGFVVSRYDVKGAQRAVYIPKSYLKIGQNELVIFELFEASSLSLYFMTQSQFDFILRSNIEHLSGEQSSAGKICTTVVVLCGISFCIATNLMYVSYFNNIACFL